MTDPHEPLINAIDMEVLMHRDAHFSGNFEIMIEYYDSDGVGIMPDFTIEQIKRLKTLEHELKQNLSETYLPDPAKKIVEDSRALYQSLRDVYSEKNPDPISILMSDLILAEEENPEKEITALVSNGSSVVPALIHLLSSPSFYDPLFPGYGRSPIFAARCLGQIKDERAIIPLFEALGHENFFTDEEIIGALRSFGEPAKTFLINVLKSEPLTKDNEHAAISICSFPEEEEIAKACLEVLQKESTLKNLSFAQYLVFPCLALTQDKDRESFITLSKQENLPKSLLNEMKLVIKSWK